MYPGDLERRLQVPTRSKRPNPSPSEGERSGDQEVRTQPSNIDDDRQFQRNELIVQLTDLPGENIFANQPDTFWSNYSWKQE